MNYYNNININHIWSYLFLFLVTFYALKDVLYRTGVYSVTVAVIELSFCAIFFGLTIFLPQKPVACKLLLLFTIIVSIYWIYSRQNYVSSKVGNISTLTFYREYVGAVLLFFPAYYLARKDNFSNRLLIVFFIIYFLISIEVYFVETQNLLQKYSGDEITSNYSYLFVYLAPFLGLFQKKYITIPFWGIAIVLCIMSAKRGAIIGIAAEFLIYLFTVFKRSKRKWWVMVVCIIAFIAIYWYTKDYYNTSEYFQIRWSSTKEGNSSGRSEILTILWRDFVDSNIFQMLFGHGFVATVGVANNYAHNDWFEIIYDMGVVNVILYFYIYYYFLKFVKYVNPTYSLAYKLAILPLFLSSLYSMSFFNSKSGLTFLLLGFIMGKSQGYSLHKNKKLIMSEIRES